jgi:hypothetical protein
VQELDAVMLAHFSTSLAAGAVRQQLSKPVLTAPNSAVQRMRSLIEGSMPAQHISQLQISENVFPSPSRDGGGRLIHYGWIGIEQRD